MDIYGGSQFFFNMDMYNINTALTTEATNVSAMPIRSELIPLRQMTNAADNHGGTGWWRTQNDIGTVNGIKFELTAEL